MEPITAQEPVITEQVNNTPEPNINEALGNALWGVKTPSGAPVAAVSESGSQGVVESPASVVTPNEESEYQTIELEEYFKNEFGVAPGELKEKWNKYKDYETMSPAPSEPKWENDESKRFYDLIRENKRDEVREFLNQQYQIERLEKMNIESATSAAEILKTNLQFKNKNLSPDDISFLIEESYAKPPMPQQTIDESEDEFKARLSQWDQQVQRIDRKMIIDAKLAQNELPGYKSQIVLPDVTPAQVQQSALSQEELAKAEAGRKAYLEALANDYQKFNGFTVTAKDGEVQLPINYTVAPEETVATKQMLENLNVDEFFGTRWFEENGTPKVTLMQEDLYLLQNRDKIFQKIANEAVAQAVLNRLKTQNNIKLEGVTTAPPVSQPASKSLNEQLADAVWGKKR